MYDLHVTHAYTVHCIIYIYIYIYWEVMGADGGQAVGPIPGTATYKGSCMRHVIPTSAPIRAIHTPKHPLLAFLSICQLDPFNPTHTHTPPCTPKYLERRPGKQPQGQGCAALRASSLSVKKLVTSCNTSAPGRRGIGRRRELACNPLEIT